jgi:hypothetical protein
VLEEIPSTKKLVELLNEASRYKLGAYFFVVVVGVVGPWCLRAVRHGEHGRERMG